MGISKALHKRGRSTRKLASKLTIRDLQCSKDTIHWYLKFGLWSLFMQEAFFTQNLQNSDLKWLQFFKEWHKWTVWRPEEYHIYRWVSSVPVSAWKFAKMTMSGPNTGQNWNLFKSPNLLQKSWFGVQWHLQVCPSYMCCHKTKLWEQSITKRAFHLYLYLMIWIRPDTGHVTEKKIYENMLDLTLLQDGAPAHKATETQNLIWNYFSQF